MLTRFLGLEAQREHQREKVMGDSIPPSRSSSTCQAQESRKVQTALEDLRACEQGRDDFFFLLNNNDKR